MAQPNQAVDFGESLDELVAEAEKNGVHTADIEDALYAKARNISAGRWG